LREIDQQTTITVTDQVDGLILIGEIAFICDACKETFIVKKGVFNYCPNCGRKIMEDA